MRQNLRVSLGAVVLALATLAAVIFALINFDQRSRFEVVYDGVAWLDTRIMAFRPAGFPPILLQLARGSARATSC